MFFFPCFLLVLYSSRFRSRDWRSLKQSRPKKWEIYQSPILCPSIIPSKTAKVILRHESTDPYSQGNTSIALRNSMSSPLDLRRREFPHSFRDDIQRCLDLLFGDDERRGEADDVLVGWFGLLER